jgi:hypothetical protein
VSWRAINWAYAQPVRPATRKSVLVALADEVRDPDEQLARGTEPDPRSDGTTCWPGQDTLEQKCSLSSRRIRDHLAALEAEGYFTRSRQHKANGARTSDLYRLHLPDNLSGEDGSAHGSSNGSPDGASGRSGPKRPVGRSETSGRSNPIGDYMRRTGRWS